MLAFVFFADRAHSVSQFLVEFHRFFPKRALPRFRDETRPKTKMRDYHGRKKDPLCANKRQSGLETQLKASMCSATEQDSRKGSLCTNNASRGSSKPSATASVVAVYPVDSEGDTARLRVNVQVYRSQDKIWRVRVGGCMVFWVHRRF